LIGPSALFRFRIDSGTVHHLDTLASRLEQRIAPSLGPSPYPEQYKGAAMYIHALERFEPVISIFVLFTTAVNKHVTT